MVVKILDFVILQLEKRQVTPPFKPNVALEEDVVANFDQQFTTEPVELTPDDP